MTRICPARERKKRSLAELAGQSPVIGHAARWLADAVWPPVCPVSGETVDISGRLAPESWQGLTFLDDPLCRQCGLPFPYSGGTGSQSGALCGPCIADPPRFDMARAPLLYDDASRPLVLGFKHGGRRDMIAQFARWMAMAGRDCLDGADMIMPVPLHWRRLLARRYNQSALLGAALAEISGLPFDTDTLLRRKPTPSQAGKAVKARRRNMAGAFHVAAREAVAGRSVVLVDDVYTTGATVAACASVLRRAGVREIRIVTLCRVVRTRDATI